MSNSFFRFNIFSTIGENPVESLWRRIRRFSKKKRPQKGPILQKLPQIGEIPDKTEKTDFQPSTAVPMTKGPLEHSENAGNPFLRRLKETR